MCPIPGGVLEMPEQNQTVAVAIQLSANATEVQLRKLRVLECSPLADCGGGASVDEDSLQTEDGFVRFSRSSMLSISARPVVAGYAICAVPGRTWLRESSRCN